MKMPSKQTMRAAIAARDNTFDQQFFYGVVTTGVFCRPSCASRPALPENLRFFPTAQSAQEAGFRPCKRCQPQEVDPQLNKMLEIARYISRNPENRLTLSHLAGQASLSPSHLQRLFKATFGVSPKAYQDAIRMDNFKEALRKADDVTDALYSAGFGSPSRIYGEKMRNIGMTPGAYRAGGAGEKIAYACGTTALGEILMAATERGICFVQFADDTETLTRRLREEFPRAELAASPAQDTEALEAWIEALSAYISQGAPRPDLPLDLRGTAFQMKVWRFLLTLDEGEVITYKELAREIGNPKAVRAAASACAANRIGVLVPCHRVLRGDGGLGGYRWGLERKRALLDSEKDRKTKS